MKVILRTHDSSRAHIIVGFLQANDIDARILDAATSSVIPVVGGVRVAVPDEQAAKAERLLAEADQSQE